MDAAGGGALCGWHAELVVQIARKGGDTQECKSLCCAEQAFWANLGHGSGEVSGALLLLCALCGHAVATTRGVDTGAQRGFSTFWSQPC
jgi:hypothetical protein